MYSLHGLNAEADHDVDTTFGVRLRQAGMVHLVRRPGASRHGFTLLEILVVLAIIGLLVGLGVVHIHRLFATAQTDAARMFVRDSVKTPLFLYARHMGACPSTAEGLQALVSPPAHAEGRWRGPYLDDARSLHDPWGRPYQYRSPATKSRGNYDLYSLGPDGVESDDDIGNW